MELIDGKLNIFDEKVDILVPFQRNNIINEMADKIQRLENILIPLNFNFNKLSSLSSEAKEKLNTIQPQTLSQANRISGIKPSDISVLIVALGR